MHVSMNVKVALCVYTIHRVFTYPVNCDITLAINPGVQQCLRVCSLCH